MNQRGVILSMIFFWFFLSISKASATNSGVGREEIVKKSGLLRVCMWPEYFSISYKNIKTGKLEGIDIDLGQAFANDLSVNVEFIPTHFGIFMDDLEQDKCDIAMFGVGRTEARLKRVDFSLPYLGSGMYGISNKSNPLVQSWEDIDQEGVIVCVQKGTYMESAMRDSLKYAQVLDVTRPSQREVEVRSGRADVFITDYPYGQKMIRNYDWAQLLIPIKATEKFEYAYAVKKGQPEWLIRVNQFVSDIKRDGRLYKYAMANNLVPIIIK